METIAKSAFTGATQKHQVHSTAQYGLECVGCDQAVTLPLLPVCSLLAGCAQYCHTVLCRWCGWH